MNKKPFDPKAFRNALGAFTTGVTVVTTKDEHGIKAGLTANSFNSVSLDPPLVLWSVGKKSSAYEAFTNSEYFAVHILSAEQENISSQFAKSGVDRFAGFQTDTGPGGVPVLRDCSAVFVCKTHERYAGGDHVIIVGEVIDFESSGEAPLVFQGGKYALAVQRTKPSHNDISSVGIDWLGFLLKRAYEQLFTPVREFCHASGLRDYHYFVLSFLGMGNDSLLTDINEQLKFIGIDPGLHNLEPLISMGLISRSEDRSSPRLHLTTRGRDFLLETAAIGKRAESDSFASFDYTEQQVLKNLLVGLISNTAKNVPEIWRKEHIWQENNIWGAPVAYKGQ